MPELIYELKYVSCLSLQSVAGDWRAHWCPRVGRSGPPRLRKHKALTQARNKSGPALRHNCKRLICQLWAHLSMRLRCIREALATLLQIAVQPASKLSPVHFGCDRKEIIYTHFVNVFLEHDALSTPLLHTTKRSDSAWTCCPFVVDEPRPVWNLTWISFEHGSGTSILISMLNASRPCRFHPR